MRLLALDSALGACAAAVTDERGQVLAAERLALERSHAEALMPLVGRVLAGAGLDYADLGLIAATVGPGSFTGLRVGLAAARGLALALARPLVAVTSFEAFAAALPPERRDGRQLMVLIDSRRGDCYAQAFAEALRPAGPAELLEPAALALRLAAGRWLLAGDAAAAAAARLPAAADAAVAPGTALPEPGEIARVALARWHGALAPLPASPLYLRPPEAKRPSDLRPPPRP